MISVYHRVYGPDNEHFLDDLLYYGEDRSVAQRIVNECLQPSPSALIVWHEDRKNDIVGRHTSERRV